MMSEIMSTKRSRHASPIKSDELTILGSLEKLCKSDDLSFQSLQNLLKTQPRINNDAIKQSSFLHWACFNPNVTLEIVIYLLDVFPGAESTLSSQFKGAQRYKHHIGIAEKLFSLIQF